MAENFASLIKEQKETNKRLDLLVQATGEQAVETGAAVTEDKNTETARSNKTLNLFKSMAKSFSSFGKSFAIATKVRLKGLGGGLLKFLKATALAGLLVAALAFLESQTWIDMKQTIADFAPKLKTFYTGTLQPFFSGIVAFIQAPSWQAFKDIFDVDNPLGLVLGLAAVTALFAPGLLFAGLSLGAIAFKKIMIKSGALLGVLGTDVKARVLKPLKNAVAATGAKIWAFMTKIPPALVALKTFFLTSFLPAVVAFMVPLLPVIAAVGAISLAILALKIAFDDAMAIFEETASIGEALKVGISKFMGVVLGFIPALVLDLVGWVAGLFGFDDFKEKVQAIDPIQFIADFYKNFFDNIESFFLGIFESIKNIIPSTAFIKALLPSPSEILGNIGGIITNLYESIIQAITDILPSIDDIKAMLPSASGVLNKLSFGFFGKDSAEDNGQEPFEARARGGPFNAGRPMIVGELGPELILPSGSGQVMNAQRTEQILSSGINRGMQGMGSGGPAIVNAPVNTVNNSQSNMTSTSTPMFHPSPLLGAVNVAA